MHLQSCCFENGAYSNRFRPSTRKRWKYDSIPYWLSMRLAMMYLNDVVLMHEIIVVHT